MARQYRTLTVQELNANENAKEVAIINLDKIHFESIVSAVGRYETEDGRVPKVRDLYQMMLKDNIRVDGLPEVRRAIDVYHSQRAVQIRLSRLEAQQ